MTTAEAVTAVETLAASTGCECTRPRANYSALKPADALAHLNEHLAAECDTFERDTGLRLASVKVLRDRESDVLKSLAAHVR